MAELPLIVRCSQPAADGIQLIELARPDGGDLPAWTPGAHVAVRVPNGGLRTYSLCNDPGERTRYVIAVKREAEGRGGSRALVDGVRAGHTLHVAEPRNLFELVPGAPRYVFVAGGIGITPILSMVRAVRRAGTPFHLYYLSRHAGVTAFLPELGADELREHVTVHHDGGNPGEAFDLWPVFEEPTTAHIYCCGPRPLMDAVRDMTGHWPASRVHFEDFGSDLVRPRADDVPFEVQLGRGGDVLAVPVGASILEVLRAHGRAAASSCESGTCGTCRVGLLDGTPDHRDLVLDPGERSRAVMVCVSRATGRLVLDL